MAEVLADERAQLAPEGAALPDGRDHTLPALPLPAGLPGRLVRIARRERWALAQAWETEQARGIGFLIGTLAFGGGAIAYFVLPFEPGWASLLGLVAILALVALLARPRYPVQRVVLALLLLLAGISAGKIETWRQGTAMLGSVVTTDLTGRVVAIEHQASGRTRLTLEVIATDRPALRYSPTRLRATARAVPERLVAGDVVQGRVRLMTPSGPVRPGSYDFAFESYFSGLGATGFFLRNPERVADSGMEPSRWSRVAQGAEQLRMAMANRIRSVIGGAEGEIAAALIAGVRAGIPEPVNEDLRITGLAHVLSISGLHMALVAGTVIGGLRGAFALFPNFAARRPVRKYAAAIAIAVLAFYLLLSGNQVAAARSFLMIAVMLVAVLLDRAALSMRNLAISAVIILALTPHEVMGPSFQMSFAATAALVAGYAAWAEHRRARPKGAPERKGLVRRWLRRVAIGMAGLAATSILAGLATTVFGAYHFQRVSPLSLVANLATMPIVSILVMPFAVLASVLMPFGLDAPALHVMGEGLSLMLWIAHGIAQRSPLDAVGRIPVPALVLFAVALLVATVTTTRLRWLALPVAALGMLALVPRDLPEVLVSEDGRLVALRSADRQLWVNRSRPNAFTVSDWQRASNALGIVKPRENEALTRTLLLEGVRETPGFLCNGQACLAHAPNGVLVAWAATAGEGMRFCGLATLIVIDDATTLGRCAGTASAVVTKRDLAQRGSAEVQLDTDPAAPPDIVHAIGTPYRPWHDHRRFSREARGRPPWRKPEPQGTAPPSTQPVSEPAAEAAPEPGTWADAALPQPVSKPLDRNPVPAPPPPDARDAVALDAARP